jgi:N-acetylglucosaminylphosphatidylinositol deacetylase
MILQFALSLFVSSFCYYIHLLISPNAPPAEWKRVLLVTAHPDDECMFFGPTLVRLLGAEVAKNGGLNGKTEKRKIKVLCLSTGVFKQF